MSPSWSPPCQEDITDNRSGPGTELLPRRGSSFLLVMSPIRSTFKCQFARNPHVPTAFCRVSGLCAFFHSYGCYRLCVAPHSPDHTIAAAFRRNSYGCLPVILDARCPILNLFVSHPGASSLHLTCTIPPDVSSATEP